MAREKKITVGAINVTMQPHTPERYIHLLKNANKLRNPINIRGDKFALLSGVHKIDRDQSATDPVSGDIFRFTDIDKFRSWFNVATSDFASDDELERLRVPDNLKPNSSRFSYVFFPDIHLICYEGYYESHSLAPSHAEKFFYRLFNQDALREKYGPVEVTHIPEKDKLAKALNMRFKQKLDFFVKRPNPDSNDSAERDFLSRMQARNVAEIHETQKAVPGQSIELDQDLKTLAGISAKNGEFTISGKDDQGHPQRFSTSDHPYTEAEYFDPAVEQAFVVLKRIGFLMKGKIQDWFNL